MTIYLQLNETETWVQPGSHAWLSVTCNNRQKSDNTYYRPPKSRSTHKQKHTDYLLLQSIHCKRTTYTSV